MGKTKSTGQRLSQWREREGLTRWELASKLGVSYQSVLNWESDHGIPKLRIAIELQRMTGISVDSW